MNWQLSSWVKKSRFHLPSHDTLTSVTNFPDAIAHWIHISLSFFFLSFFSIEAFSYKKRNLTKLWWRKGKFCMYESRHLRSSKAWKCQACCQLNLRNRNSIGIGGSPALHQGEGPHGVCLLCVCVCAFAPLCSPLWLAYLAFSFCSCSTSLPSGLLGQSLRSFQSLCL